MNLGLVSSIGTQKRVFNAILMNVELENLEPGIGKQYWYSEEGV